MTTTERDAARYLHLRASTRTGTGIEVRQYAHGGSWPLYGEELDAAVDADMAAQTQTEEASA